MADKKKEQYEGFGLDSMKNTITETLEEKKEEHVDITNPLLGSRKMKTDKKPRIDRTGYTREEVKEVVDSMKTRGRKGCELPRLNIGFKPNNVLYIKIMSQITGMTITQFVNGLVEKSLEENKELYQKAVDIRKEFAPAGEDYELTGENANED